MRKLAAILQSWGPGGAFLLALMDSAGVPFPVAVDALLILTAATNPAMAYYTAALCIAGSVVGSMILFGLARAGGHRYLESHLTTPWARRFHEWFDIYGLVTVFIPTLVPIPLPMKIFVVSAGALGMSPGWFLATVLAGRIPRYFVLAALGKAVGEESVGWVKSHQWQLLLGSVVLGAALMWLSRYAAARSQRQTRTDRTMAS